MKTFTIMIGNIGAGKSTFIKSKIRKDGDFVVCKDSFRYMLGGGNYIFDERTESAITLGQWYLIGNLLQQGLPIILDETNQSKNERQQFIQLAKFYNYKVIAMQMPILSKEESVWRRLQNNHGTTPKEVWEMVWERKNSEYEAPSLDEGFDEILYYANQI